jgi:RNA polymerase sigma-70 factor (ECF subfamily)
MSRDEVALVRGRDPDTLEAVARTLAPRLLRAARAAGLGADAAQDVVQDVFLVFIRKADQYDGRASVSTWLFGMMFKRIAEWRRSSAREEETGDIEAVVDARFDREGGWLRPPRRPDAGAAAAEAMRRLEECLDALPVRRRSAFVLREIEQMQTDEICKILEVSSNNLGVLLFRARNALRECLEMKGIRGLEDVTL